MIDVINGWLKEHGMRGVTKETLPPVVVINEHAAGALIETNTDVALIDFVVGNPQSSRRNVRNSIEWVVTDLMRIARKKGYKRILGFTQKSGIIGVAKQLGYKVRGDFKLLERGI